MVFAVTAALVTVLVDRRASWPAEPSGPNLGHAGLGSLLPVLLAAMLVGAGSAAVWTFGPDQLTDIGQLPATSTALLWCLLGGAGALGAVSGDLVNRIGLRRTWTLGATVTATSTLLLGVPPDVVPLAALTLIGFGGGYVALSGVLIIWAARLSPQRAAEVTVLPRPYRRPSDRVLRARTAHRALIKRHELHGRGLPRAGQHGSRRQITNDRPRVTCMRLALLARGGSSPVLAGFRRWRASRQ